MKINGVIFNEEWARTVGGEVFIKHFLPVVWPELPEAQRKEKLSAAYKLLVGEQEQPEKPKRAKAKKPEEKNEGAE
jgi:hypothetical protein